MTTARWLYSLATFSYSIFAKANKGVVLKKKDVLVIETLPTPTADENEVLVKMKAVGICGSDVHYWTACLTRDFEIYKSNFCSTVQSVHLWSGSR